MKGKVGEAMSFGLPVVTTSFGAEGFGIDPNRDLLVADTAQGFADHIESLLKDDGLYERVARSGYDFISAHFAEAQVEAALRECLGKAMEKRPQRRSIAKSIRFAVDNFYAKNIAWRIGRS